MKNVPWFFCVAKIWPPCLDQLIFQRVNFFSEIGLDVTFQQIICISTTSLFGTVLMSKKCTGDFIMRMLCRNGNAIFEKYDLLCVR